MRRVPTLMTRLPRSSAAALGLLYALAAVGAPILNWDHLSAQNPAATSSWDVESSGEPAPPTPHSHDGQFCLACHALAVPAHPSVPAWTPAPPITALVMAGAPETPRHDVPAHPLRARDPPSC